MKVVMNPSPRQESPEGPKCCANACAGSVRGGFVVYFSITQFGM